MIPSELARAPAPWWKAPSAAGLALLAALAVAGCAPSEEPPSEEPAAAAAASADAAPLALDPPAGPGALAPNLAAAENGVLLTWLEPLAEGGHAFYLSRLEGDAWGPPREIARGDDFFANWADLPAAAESNGLLVAHWLGRLGEATYAYGVQLAASDDGGETWRELGLLHDDRSATEHGFVSYLPEDGGLRAFWLDGREMERGEPMQLRTALVTPDGPGPSEVLDARVCDCCSTEAVATAAGPLVVYRDRSEGETRDVARIRADGDGWSAPEDVHADGWEIHGCPVNGPAVVASGERVATVWFTAPRGQASVRAAFSRDAGATFDAPITIDADAPLGRVDATLDPRGRVWASWLASAGDGAEIRVARVTPEGVEEPRAVATTRASRAAGVPRLVADGDRLVVAWVEVSEPSRLRAAVLPIP